MAVTATLIRASAYRLLYNLNHDGAGGDTVTITNAQLLAAAVSSPRMQEMLNTAVANDAAAAILLVGAAPGTIRLLPTGIGDWAVDVTALNNRVQVTLTGETGVANDAVLEIQRVLTVNE